MHKQLRIVVPDTALNVGRKCAIISEREIERETKRERVKSEK